MINTLSLAAFAVALSAAGAGYAGYDYGTSKQQAEYAEAQLAAQAAIEELEKKNAKLDKDVLAANQAAQVERVRTVVKYRDRLVSLPARDCGFTAAERVLVASSYCAAFPTHPDCVQAAVPVSADATGEHGR